MRLGRFVATLACAGVLGAAPTAVAGATTPRAPSEEFCGSFREYFQATFGVALAVSFAKTFDAIDDAESKGSTPDEVHNTLYLALSPKLEKLTRQMAPSAPRILRKSFRTQAKAFAVGVDLLRGLGLTDDQIQEIAESPVDLESADPERQSDTLDVSKDDLAKAADRFGAQRARIDVENIGATARDAYSTVGSQCGAFPSPDVDCAELITLDEASEILGVPATGPDDCEYEGPEPDTGVTPALGVDVYESPDAFETLTRDAQNQDVPGVGDAAVALEGYSVFAGIQTCGKTLVVRAGERTVVVALCLPGEADVPIETLTGLAARVLERLG